MPRARRSVPRYIKPENIEIGDVIKVSWSAGGIDHTRTARVHRRIDVGVLREIYNAEGYQILAWVPGGKNPLVTLVERQMKEQVSTLDDLLERLA